MNRTNERLTQTDGLIPFYWLIPPETTAKPETVSWIKITTLWSAPVDVCPTCGAKQKVKK